MIVIAAQRTLAGVGLATLLLAGCASAPQDREATPAHVDSSNGADATTTREGGGYYQNDGPPNDRHIDLDAIPDAVPRDDPPSAYGNPASYEALGKTYYVLASAAGFTQTGRASWYGRQFHGRRTSSGEPYNMFTMTAAHKRLPIPSYVQVTNLDNDKHVIVRVNDRGPFHDGRIIDLSYAAARRLGIVAEGSAPVRIKTVTPASLRAEDSDDSSQLARSGHSSAVVVNPGAAQKTSTRYAAASAPVPASRAPARPVPVANRMNADASVSELYLQSGAFSSEANAHRLRKQLKEAGFNEVTIVDPDATTPLYRVRLGPFQNERGRALTIRILGERGFSAREVDR